MSEKPAPWCCKACGTVDDEVAHLREEVETYKAEWERALRRERFQKAKLAVQDGTSAKGQSATRVLEAWMEACVTTKGRKPRIEAGTDKHALVLRLLARYSEEDLITVVRTLGRWTCIEKGSNHPGTRVPHSCPGGPSTRACAHGGTRYADIFNALGGEKGDTKIDWFLTLAEIDPDEAVVAAPSPAPRAPAPARDDWRHPINRVLDALNDHDIDWRVTPEGPLAWTASCPHHPDAVLAIRTAADERVVLDCAGGCGSWPVAQALGVEYADIVDTPGHESFARVTELAQERQAETPQLRLAA